MTVISVRALISVYSFAHRALYFARVDKEYLKRFEFHATRVLKKIKAKHDVLEPSWNGKRKFQIVRRILENQTGDICSFYLVPVDKRPLPQFRPGQFLTFEMPASGDAEPIVRCYSLSESPLEQRYYRISVKRLLAPPHAPPGTFPGLASNYFHDVLQEGEIIDIAAPAGEFCLHQRSPRPVVLIAGGVGITPLLSMLNWLVATKSQRDIWLFYGVRNRADHAMYDHLKDLQRDCPNLRLITFYSEPTEMCRQGVDYDVEGFVSVDIMKAVLRARNYEFYVCGPPPMMTMVMEGLAQWGVPEEDIMSEAFGPASVKKPTLVVSNDPAVPQKAAEAFNIVFSRSNKTLQWTPEAGSILEFAEENGVQLRSGCRVGNCGTCVSKIAKGDVDYVRKPSKQLKANACLACIAKPKSDLVLDL